MSMAAARRPPAGILGYAYSRAGAVYFSERDPRPFRSDGLVPVEWCTPVASCAAWMGEQKGAPADWPAVQAAGRWVGPRPAPQPLHITELVDWLAARYRAAGGKAGITDVSAWAEEVMRWTEEQHGIGTTPPQAAPA